MAKVHICISDGEEPHQVNIRIEFDPILKNEKNENLTKAQEVGMGLLQAVRETCVDMKAKNKGLVTVQ